MDLTTLVKERKHEFFFDVDGVLDVENSCKVGSQIFTILNIFNLLFSSYIHRRGGCQDRH